MSLELQFNTGKNDGFKDAKNQLGIRDLRLYTDAYQEGYVEGYQEGRKAADAAKDLSRRTNY